MMTLQPEQKQPIIFCDFDGTITERDVIIMVMERFAPPEWKDIADRILKSRTLSLKDGMQQLFALIASSKKREIEAFVAQEVKLRAGLRNFLSYCQQQAWPVLVVSGGLDCFIEPVLQPLFAEGLLDSHHVYANQVDFSQPTIGVKMPYDGSACLPCGQCACCKLRILDLYPPALYDRIIIGDSLTDLGMAKAADHVFARHQLQNLCLEENLQFTPFETFHDIVAYFEAQTHVVIP
jgi:2-hydroxy-3-keto-5-methylthiopentenyl-1-phosphate phosphatase